MPRLIEFPILFLCKIRGFFIKRKLSGKNSQVWLNNPFFRITITKKKGAKFLVEGMLYLRSHFGETNRTSIYLDENATLLIGGDFEIGNGIRIYVAKNGLLKIGGNDIKSELGKEGITSNSAIFVYKKVEIGKDFLCAWNVFITDCDWHYAECNGNFEFHSDVHIGNHVWINPNCSILKGTNIGNGSIVGNHSLLNDIYPGNSLIAGVPAKVIKRNCKWSCELPRN